MRKFLLSASLLVMIASYSQAQFKGSVVNWLPGCYYDMSGNKTCGLLSEYIRAKTMFDGEKHFLYKKDDDGEPLKVYAKDTKAFVVGKDSFVVSNSELLDETPYLQVGIDKSIKLFIARLPRQLPGIAKAIPVTQLVNVAMAENVNNTKNKYYYGASQDSIIEVKRKDFVEVMSKIMADKPNVVAKIQDNTYRFVDLDNLLAFYLTGVEPAATQENDPSQHPKDQ